MIVRFNYQMVRVSSAHLGALYLCTTFLGRAASEKMMKPTTMIRAMKLPLIMRLRNLMMRDQFCSVSKLEWGKLGFLSAGNWVNKQSDRQEREVRTNIERWRNIDMCVFIIYGC